MHRIIMSEIIKLKLKARRPRSDSKCNQILRKTQCVLRCNQSQLSYRFVEYWLYCRMHSERWTETLKTANVFKVDPRKDGAGIAENCDAWN